MAYFYLIIALSAFSLCMYLLNPYSGILNPDKNEGKPVVANFPVNRTKEGLYVVLVAPSEWNRFSNQLARGMKDYGVDGIVFVEQPGTVIILKEPTI